MFIQIGPQETPIQGKRLTELTSINLTSIKFERTIFLHARQEFGLPGISSRLYAENFDVETDIQGNKYQILQPGGKNTDKKQNMTKTIYQKQ